MDADTGHLQRFTDVPYVIEAAAGKASALGGAAAAALAKSGLRVRLDAGRGLAPGRYRDLVESIRVDLERNLRATPGYDINLFDMSNRDREAEIERVSKSLRGGGKDVHKLAAAKGAFAAGFRTTDGVAHCIVVPFKPDFPIDPVLSRGLGKSVAARGAIDDAIFHRLTMTHEIGHCLLGTSEAKADAFAFLMALRDPSFPKDALVRWASWREREEWTLAVTEDDHFTAKAAWVILERADALRADPAFRALDVEGIAGLAKAFVEEHGASLDEEAEIAAVRRGLRAGTLAVSPRAGLREGVSPILAWLRRNADVPAIGRVVSLFDNAGADATALPAFEAAPGAFRTAIAALAERGDQIARAVVRGYDAKPRADTAEAREVASYKTGSALEQAIPYRFRRTPFETRATARMADGLRAAPRAVADEVDAPAFR